MENKKSPAVRNKDQHIIEGKKAVTEQVENGTGKIPKKGGYYKVGAGKFEPDAWRAQEEANEAGISIEIVHYEINDQYVEVHVIGKTKDGQTAPGFVHHNFQTIISQKAMELYKKELAGQNILFGAKDNKKRIQVFENIDHPFELTSDNNIKPILTGAGMAKLYDDFLQFKNFSIRDALTKASRIAQLKLTNSDWRDKEEIELEEKEVKEVENKDTAEKATQKDVDKKEAQKKARKTKKDKAKKEEKVKDEVKQEKKETTDKEPKKETKSKAKPDNEEKIAMETPGDNDEITKATGNIMTGEEIGRKIVTWMEREGEELKPSVFGKHIMKLKREKIISTKKYDEARQWFLNTQF